MSTAKKTITLLAAALFTIALVSCDLLFGSSNSSDSLDVLNAGEFYAQNMETEKYYKVKAEQLVVGTHCVIWAEKGSGVTKLQAQMIADEYDKKIRPTIVGTFSKKKFTVTSGGEIYPFDDMLDFANALAGWNNKKLTILLLDIKDGFDPDKGNDSFIAGYFFSGNFFPVGNIEINKKKSEHYSNSRDMIYIDTYPGLGRPEQAYTTFAHELQHLINYVTSVQMGRDSLMDTWVDEGLSSQAEHLYLGHNVEEKIKWFIADPAGTIAKGNNFFVWGNNTGNPVSILDEYATVYLFFRWLYLQANAELKPHVFYDIITANNTDYRAVTNVAEKIKPEWDKWEPLLSAWLAANYFPKNSYGYIGDVDLQGRIKVNPIGAGTIGLYPGEGVYSIISSPVGFQETGNIRYENLDDVLLTFNASTINDLQKLQVEIGQLTGVPVPAASQTSARSALTGKPSRPYVIDAQDVLGRNKW